MNLLRFLVAPQNKTVISWNPLKISSFRGFFYSPKNVKTCRFRNLKISHSVFFQNPSKKPPFTWYFTYFQSFAETSFRYKRLLLPTCLNVEEKRRIETTKGQPGCGNDPTCRRMHFPPFSKIRCFFPDFRWFFRIEGTKKTTGRFPSLPFKLTELKRYSTT